MTTPSAKADGFLGHARTIMEVKRMQFDGPCPFLTCFADGPHDHPICPKCGAVRYGNLYCDECRKNIDIHRELAVIEIKAKSISN